MLLSQGQILHREYAEQERFLRKQRFMAVAESLVESGTIQLLQDMDSPTTTYVAFQSRVMIESMALNAPFLAV
jgi:hypothetical protein